MREPPRVEIQHGKLAIRFPRKAFDSDGEPNELELLVFRDTLSARYPWLSRFALDEIMENGRVAALEAVEAMRTGFDRAEDRVGEGDDEGAVRMLEAHLESDPDDADAWYALGRLLCKLGRTAEGYKAFSRGRP